MDEAAVLRATMTDRVTVTRETLRDGQVQREAVYQRLPCALSKTVQGNSPTLSDQLAQVMESDFRLRLFLPAGTVIETGDRAEIQRMGQRFSGVCSASLPYPSHSVCTLSVQEVRAL